MDSARGIGGLAMACVLLAGRTLRAAVWGGPAVHAATLKELKRGESAA